MHADLVLVLLVIVFGCAAFLFGLVYIVGSMVGAVGRGFWSFLRPTSRWGGGCGMRLPGIGRSTGRACPNCRHVDSRAVCFCSRCGSKVDASGVPRGQRGAMPWWLG